MRTFKKGGIHPPENKITANSPIKSAPVPAELRIMLSQCIGAPSKPVVKPGDSVTAGQLIAEPGGFIGAAIHSPVNGTVKKIEPTRTLQGIWQDSIVISVSPESQSNIGSTSPGIESPRTQEEVDSLSAREIIDIVKECGVVGMGGATFPTHVKLSVPEGKKVTHLLINGAECEPCLTCDDALMRHEASGIVKGTLLIMKATGASQGIIGIEENKPEAIAAMTSAAAGHPSLSVVTLKKKYPQGGEKQLIFALTGKTVPAGALPLETGCIVDNVATAFAVHDAVYNRRPLTRRIVTVTGPSLKEPCNLSVVNGTPVATLIDLAGGVPDDTGKIVAGGPMMGRAVSDIDATATKGLSGVVVIPQAMSLRKQEQPCIRCARCISACPMGLEPYLLMLQADVKMWDAMAEHGVMNCIECGCCTYSCPANRPILDMLKLGKQQIRSKK